MGAGDSRLCLIPFSVFWGGHMEQGFGDRYVGFLTRAFLGGLIVASTGLYSRPVQAEIPKEIHQACLKASDYQGCIKANMNKPVSDSTNSGQMMNGAKDRFGLPMLDPGRFKGPVSDSYGGEFYLDLKSIRALKNSGNYGRYFAWEMVYRAIANPVAPTAGYQMQTSGGSTNCQGSAYGSFGGAYGSSNCYSTPPTSVFIPGMAGFAGGPRQILMTYVIDCIDQTYQVNKKGRWVALGSGEYNLTSKLAVAICSSKANGELPRGEEI